MPQFTLDQLISKEADGIKLVVYEHQFGETTAWRASISHTRHTDVFQPEEFGPNEVMALFLQRIKDTQGKPEALWIPVGFGLNQHDAVNDLLVNMSLINISIERWRTVCWNLGHYYSMAVKSFGFLHTNTHFGFPTTEEIESSADVGELFAQAWQDAANAPRLTH